MPNPKKSAKKDTKLIESKFPLKVEIEESKHLKMYISDGVRTKLIVISKTTCNYETRKKTISTIRRVLRNHFNCETKQSDFSIDYFSPLSRK